MTHWRNRMGEERLQALLQESLAVATKTGAMKLGVEFRQSYTRVIYFALSGQRRTDRIGAASHAISAASRLLQMTF
jgi:hypothetical protein